MSWEREAYQEGMKAVVHFRSMEREFTAVYVPSDGWWAAYVEEIPGVNSQGKTLDEARENLQDALLLMLDALRKDSIAEDENVVRETVRLKAS